MFPEGSKSSSVSLRIQSECEKIRTRITPNRDTFYAVGIPVIKLDGIWKLVWAWSCSTTSRCKNTKDTKNTLLPRIAFVRKLVDKKSYLKETLDSEVTAHINLAVQNFRSSYSFTQKETHQEASHNFQDLKIMCILPTFADLKACRLKEPPYTLKRYPDFRKKVLIVSIFGLNFPFKLQF